MDAELENLFQTQYNTERQNAEEYLQRGNVLEGYAWDGCAHFMFKAAGEEREHAAKFADFLNARNVQPIAAPLNAVNTVASNNNPYPYFREVYELEVKTTDKINALYRAAENADDPQACEFLHFFLAEQTRSVKETYDMVQQLSRADCSAALIALDEKYGEL